MPESTTTRFGVPTTETSYARNDIDDVQAVQGAINKWQGYCEEKSRKIYAKIKHSLRTGRSRRVMLLQNSLVVNR
jgi:hypothetical protein